MTAIYAIVLLTIANMLLVLGLLLVLRLARRNLGRRAL